MAMVRRHRIWDIPADNWLSPWWSVLDDVLSAWLDPTDGFIRSPGPRSHVDVPQRLSGAGDWRAPALLALILCSSVAVGVATPWWQKARESAGLLIFGAGTFVIGLLPLLPFSRDWSYYNLAIPLIGVSIVVAALLQWVPIGNVLSVVAAAGIFSSTLQLSTARKG